MRDISQEEFTLKELVQEEVAQEGTPKRSLKRDLLNKEFLTAREGLPEGSLKKSCSREENSLEISKEEITQLFRMRSRRDCPGCAQEVTQKKIAL